MRKLAAASSLAFFAAPAWAQNPSISTDYANMMSWLSNETVQGLSFNAGSTFDPPNELRPWHMQPDVSLGVGMIPLNKRKFPVIGTPSLAEKNPSSFLPGLVTIPNLTLHLRLGLPGRMDFSIRGANMTVPKGYRMTPSTRGDGQSNSIGFGLRRHFFGGDLPLLSVGGSYNHVKGHFNFSNQLKNQEIVTGFFVDSQNEGRLEWNVNSIGVNAVVSQTYGVWTPFLGTGWNYVTGSVKARLQSDYNTTLISPSIGEASDHPEQHQARFILGAQMDRAHFSFFVNGEVKAIGASAGKTFIISSGVVAPFRIGAASLAAKAPSRRQTQVAYDVDGDAAPEPSFAQAAEPPARREAPRREPRPITDYREASGREPSGREDMPEMILIR